MIRAMGARNEAGEPQVRAFAATTRNLVEEARRIHHQSATATAAVGRLLTAGVMMGGMLENEGDLVTIQIRGDGPIRGITVTADSQGGIKGYAVNPAADLEPKSPGHLNVGGLIGRGTLTVIRDMGLKEPYSGTVDLRSGEIAEDLAWYFASSEQVPSAVDLGVLVDTDLSCACAGGFLIQMMPFAEDRVITKLEQNISRLPHVTTLLSAGDTPEQLLRQAMDGLDVEITETKPVAYHCNCSRERVEKVLLSMGRKDLQSLIDEGKDIELACQFCGKKYRFTPGEAQALLDSAR